MLTTSGARFGFRATLPHLLGVPIGTGLLAAASVLGKHFVCAARDRIHNKIDFCALDSVAFLETDQRISFQGTEP